MLLVSYVAVDAVVLSILLLYCSCHCVVDALLLPLILCGNVMGWIDCHAGNTSGRPVLFCALPL